MRPLLFHARRTCNPLSCVEVMGVAHSSQLALVPAVIAGAYTPGNALGVSIAKVARYRAALSLVYA